MSPRLREIEMSEYDAETYESFSGHVRRQVQAMRVIIDSLQVHELHYNNDKMVTVLLFTVKREDFSETLHILVQSIS